LTSAALGQDGVDNALSALGIAPVDNDFDAFAGETQPDRAADSGGRASDERVLSEDVSGSVCSRTTCAP
jgi:hypothetical protein